MRQGQQNRRGRGRGGRKPQNPLARSYESNGPDVKIRGTAAHVAEKYMSLARDALASGDMVMAESYLQHAEHYNRIIMAAQTQMGAPQGGQPGEPNGGSFRPSRFNSDEGDEEFAAESGEPGAGSQDQRRHSGDREHHAGGREAGGREGGGRDQRRHGGNGRERGESGENGSDQPESPAKPPIR
jgi:hypothetical protein